MRRVFLLRPARAVVFAALFSPAFGFCVLAAGSAIDPDPHTPSLSELLQREEESRNRKAVAVPAQEARTAAALPAGPQLVPAPAAAVGRPKAVRQVYPSPYHQHAVTVLVPGGRLPPR